MVTDPVVASSVFATTTVKLCVVEAPFESVAVITTA